MKKQFIKVLALSALASLALSGCSEKAPTTPNEQDDSKKVYNVGVIQYATHASLDNCYEGFVAGLAEKGIVEGDNLIIDFQNSNSDTSNSDLQAKNMVSSKRDMLVGIATPSAMSAYVATKDAGIPMVFTAVSDPLVAGIVSSLTAPGGNCTGSSDVLNFDEQLKLIRAFLPEAKTIGVLYTTSEPNSISHLARLETAAAKQGFTIEAVGVTSASEVATATAAIVAKKVDCVTNFTDNNVVDNLSTVLHATDEAGIPVFGSEIEQVKNGCLASMSIDYIELGRVTGNIAAQILLGEAEAGSIPIATESSCFPVYNSAVAEKLGLKLPAEYSDIMDAA
ncbi:MAG: ABC transporter substrate-binding protein [Oscillospiraceae bacterium]